MKDMKIIDLLKDEKPYELENTDLILITGITESTLNDAITIAESARESGVVTIGIPASDDDMRRFSDVADAVIFTRNESDISRTIAEELSELADNSARILANIFRNAGTVHYGSGADDELDSAIRNAAEMCGDIHGAKTAHVKISVPFAKYDHEAFWEIEKDILKEICGHGVKSVTRWDSNEDGKFTAKFFALMYDAGYTSWCELFANESAENITAMIENGLDGRTKRLGTEKSFFAACLRFGTPELVRKFISKGHNPKELETDGIFPGDVLADCLMNDIKARNTGMTDILLESGISLGEHCVKALAPSLRNPKILQAFINYGWNVNSRDENGANFMFYAAAECSYECVKLLAEAGADINARRKKGYTPLMILMIMMINCSNDADTAHEILKYLLANGADINATADDGTTPLTQAATWIYSHPDIVRTFLNAGANVNAEFTDGNGGRLSVLDIMFASSVSVFSEPEEKQIFLREVLPMMINAGANFSLSESQPRIDDKYQDFRRNWKSLLTDPANKPHALRLFCDSIAEYDTETVRGIIERISPEKIVPDCGESPSEFIRMSARLTFRINDFPESVSKPSARNTEIKRRLDNGAEILRILHEAGITWSLVLPEGTELTYVINEEWKPRKKIVEMNPLSLCHSPEALKKVIASGKYDTSSALKEIAGSCEIYYQPGEMMNILLANGADIHALSDTYIIGECLSYRGKLLMLDNFQQAKFIAEIFRKHNLSDITTVSNTQHYDGWEEYCGGPLSCHMLSHLWELIESGTDNAGKWAKFRDVMMLLSACRGNVNDIEDAINHGGNINYSTWLGYTPLMYAAVFNDSEAVKFLIKNRADINARNIHNQNAAMLAVTSDYNARDSNVIRVLAEFGADIHNGLMSRAVDAGNVDAVKVLLSLGAKLPGQNAVNNPEPETRNEKPCPKCGRIFSRANDYCPSCGYVLPVSERYRLARR